MLEALIQWDQQLFLKMNTDWTSSSLDYFFSYITNAHKQPVVLYGILPLLIGYWIFKAKKGVLPVVLCLGIVAGLTDLICYRGIKKNTYRARPNQEATVNGQLRVPYGPKSSSFPSNHAATTTALAATLIWYYPSTWIYFGLWTLAIGYSRIYVGVHYPMDVLGGFLIGSLIAMLLIRFVWSRFDWFSRPRGTKPQAEINLVNS